MQISAILFNSKYTLTTINLYFKLMPPPGNGSYGKLSRSVVNNSSVDWTGTRTCFQIAAAAAAVDNSKNRGHINI